MANYPNRIKTLRDILVMSPEERKNQYQVNTADKHIDKVTINGNVFTDYKAFSFVWAKTYVTSPERSADGTIGNLNSYPTFLTPHLKIDFGLMSIDSYRKIMKLIYTSNEFVVTCYDVVNNKDTTNRMYFSTEEMPKLWTIVDALNGDENAIMLLGVQDYVVEMIGTNAALDVITVNYYLNSPTGIGQTTPIYSEDVPIGSEIVLGLSSGIENYSYEGYVFNRIWGLKVKDSSGREDDVAYTHNSSFNITKAIVNETSNSINFYAEWKDTNTYTLTYSYGLGEPKIDDFSLQEITSKQVEYGSPIGELPYSESLPTVTYGEGEAKKTYYPYKNPKWYKTSMKVGNSLPLESGDIYWQESSTTIYQLYDKENYQLEYILDGIVYQTLSLGYGDNVPLPNLVKQGYTFSGWFIDEEFTKNAPTIMPPYTLKLYAKFTENK